MATMAQLGDRPEGVLAPRAHTPTVLLINDDAGCTAHCASLLEELGYRYQCTTRTRDALEKIGSDASIEILWTEVGRPAVDGFRLIEEARSRFTGGRLLAPVLLADHATAELAMKGLHVEAVDLVTRPLDIESCSIAMRRAMRYLTSRRQTVHSVDLSQFTQQLARLAGALEGSNDASDTGEITGKQIRATLQNLIATRRLRNRFFQSELFADPVWDILLDLARAKLEGQEVSVSSVCIAASVPMSTALRWVRHMTDNGLLRRWTDPNDRRRDLIALTDTAAGHMREYLALVHSMVQKM